ncbi:MAG TPA: hypothetical protein PKE04_02140 [Clostridia bacterium]|nr:hypothetical protein [Clostridia bacterium]
MKRWMKKILLAGAVLGLSLSVTACAQLQNSLDVIGKSSIPTLEAVVNAAPQSAEPENGYWTIQAPDASARVFISRDWSQTGDDLVLEWDAAPFLQAGLDPAQLPEAYGYDGTAFRIGVPLGDDGNPGETGTLAEAYGRIVTQAPGLIGYHAQLNHFGVEIGQGNLLEWARDLRANDKDMVFVLNPEPLIEAGVDPEAVEGWVYATVKVHVAGKSAEVYKFLKPFDLDKNATN